MKRIILVFLSIIAGLAARPLDITLVEGWSDAPSGSQMTGTYKGNSIRFDILDNSSGAYSPMWGKTLVAGGISVDSSDPMGRIADYPDGVLYGGEAYMVIALGKISGFSDVTSLRLPYELRFVMDEAFSDPEERWLDSFRLPPATARLGRNSFSGQSAMGNLNIQAPFPPVCVLSDGREVTVGDALGNAAGPFPKFSAGCTLTIPAGSAFFYRNHPCFSDVFTDLREISMEDVWPIYEDNMSVPNYRCPVRLGYVGNCGLMLLSMEYDDDIGSSAIPVEMKMQSYFTAEGFPCHVIGIGPGACKGTVCSKMTLPATVRFVCDDAFRNSALKEVTIPESCRFVGPKAFAGCYALRTVTLMSTEPPVFAPDAFDGISKDATLVTYAPVDPEIAPWNAFGHIDDRSGHTLTPTL